MTFPIGTGPNYLWRVQLTFRSGSDVPRFVVANAKGEVISGSTDFASAVIAMSALVELANTNALEIRNVFQTAPSDADPTIAVALLFGR